jgi:hypothetical protein
VSIADVEADVTTPVDEEREVTSAKDVDGDTESALADVVRSVVTDVKTFPDVFDNDVTAELELRRMLLCEEDVANNDVDATLTLVIEGGTPLEDIETSRLQALVLELVVSANGDVATLIVESAEVAMDDEERADLVRVAERETTDAATDLEDVAPCFDVAVTGGWCVDNVTVPFSCVPRCEVTTC